jgi:hypothetical protein
MLVYGFLCCEHSIVQFITLAGMGSVGGEIGSCAKNQGRGRRFLAFVRTNAGGGFVDLR